MDSTWNVEEPLDYGYESLGEQRVKNISEPLRVYRVRLNESTSAGAPDPNQALPFPDKPSIAVLAFDNMSGDPDQEYFADGIVEEITAALSRVRTLFVIARNSSFTYKGRAVDIKQVSRELGVRYVLEGSVRKSGNRVRITAQLIEATGGSHIWAERYDGVLEDIFDLQDQITESVVGAIEPRLRSAEIERSKRKRPEDLDAYDCFLRALPHVHAMTAEGNAEALRLLGKAIAFDPHYGSAMALAAWCYCLRPAQGWVAPDEDEAREGTRLARAAIENDRENPETLWLAGYTLAFLGDALDEGLGLIDRSLALDPNAAQAWVFSGWVRTYLGDAETAVEHFEKAMRLSPLDSAAYRAHSGLAFAYLFLQRYDDAATWAAKALQGNLNFSPTHRVLAASLAHADRLDEARAAVERLLALVPDLTVTRFGKFTRFRHPENFALLIDGLRKAGLPE